MDNLRPGKPTLIPLSSAAATSISVGPALLSHADPPSGGTRRGCLIGAAWHVASGIVRMQQQTQ